MLATLRNRNFTLLWTGGLISLIGNWVLLAALPFHVYQITGSALATSGLLMAYIAPGILFSSVAGVFVDRWNRRRTMIVTALLQGLILLSLLAVQSPDWLWLIYVALFIEATLGRFFSPAENALLPTLVGEEHLLSANSLNALNDNLARLVGPAIGGLLLAMVGFQSVIIIDAASYLLAALLISLVQAPVVPAPVAAAHTEPAQVQKSGPRQAWVQVWRDWVAGLALVRRSRLLASIFLVVGVALFGDAIISAVLVVFVQVDMGLGAVQFGWLMTARGVGGLIGGLLIAQMAARLKPGQLISWGLVSGGVLILIALAVPTLAAWLPLLVLVGISAIAWIVSLQTLLQQGTEDAYRGRVFGAFGTTTTLLMFVGTAIGGALADQIGATSLMAASAFFFVGAGALAALLLGSRIAQPAPAAAD